MITDGGILYSQIDSQLPSFVSTDHSKFSKFIEKYYEFLELNLITFTDLDLNEDAILQEKANTTYSITVATGNNAYSNSVNKFYVDGAVSPTITLTSGSYSIFDQGDETNQGHYFYISKTPDGIHSAGGTQFTTDDRGDVLFTYEGSPGDYDNITLQDNSGVLLYEDMTFSSDDDDIVFDNLANEDGSGDIFLYNEIITAGGYISFEAGHHVLMEEFTGQSENEFIQSEDFTVDETGTVEIALEITTDIEVGLESSSTIEFYVSPDLAGETLYYYCNNHSGMGGNITVSSATTYISQENGNTDSSNTSTTDYITIESPSRQGDQFLSGEIILGANSGATGIVKGKYSNTQAYIQETNNGAFEVGESISGKTSRATANVSSYSRQPINASRNVKSFQDIDKAPPGFVELFRKEFLYGFSKNADISTSNLLKNIKDFYRAKGNENSFRYVFRLLFGIDDVEFYYPSNDLMRLSDGRWTLDKSVKILTDSASHIDSFLGRTIVGGTSNVSALVERIERYQVGALDVTELFLSGFDANNSSYQATTGTGYTTFYLGETITANSADDDGNYATATTSGVLQGVDITIGGSGYEKGDEIQVTGGGGTGAKAKVGSIAAAALTGIDVIDSGDGYSVGDIVTFINDGTGGTGGSARVDSIVKTVNVFTQTEVISTFQSETINSSAFLAPWNSHNANTHQLSNSTTTFTVPFDGLSGTTPKEGDFIAKFGSGESITLYTPGTSKFATVISTNSTSITYGLGSIDYQTTHNVDPTLNNFADDDAVTIFDLSKDSSGSAITSNGYNATFRATGATFNINGTPTANNNGNFHGAYTMQESEIGGVRSLQILSSGQGYETIPPVSVANGEMTSYGNAPEKMGANSIFVNLANTIANTFSANTLVKNSGNTAFGIVLDFLDLASTTLADTGNTTLRIQMTSANTFSPNDILTSYNRTDSSPTGIGEFGTANISTSGTTATFTQADHGFGAGERIVITGSESATDNTVYNNNHTIAGITNSSTYTVTLASDPSDDSETALTIRKIVTANVLADLILTEDSTATQLSLENGVGTGEDDYSSSTSNGSIIVESGIDEANSTFANTGAAGNNAVISVAELAVGAIETVLVYDFGAGYSSAPTINASAVGDGRAILTGNVGVYAEYAGYFDGDYGLLSGTNKMQDNLYYQDFSYVVKTDTDVATYRDKILELVHPAGMALFGEILMTSNLSTTLFDNGTRNINSTQANTALVANSVNVPLYRIKEIEFYTSNTASTNNQISVESSFEFKSFSSGIFAGKENDAHLDTTGSSVDFDLQLEHGNDLFSLEVSGFFLAFENTGELLLEQDIGGGVGDRLIEETADFLLTEADIIHITLEEDSQVTGTDILLLEDGLCALENEGSQGSAPIIYEFTEPALGKVIGEDDSIIIVDVLSHDVLEIQEYTGDFMVMDGIRDLVHITLEEDSNDSGTDALILDGIVTIGAYITFETEGSQHSGSVLLNSTDGAPASDAGDKIISENFELSTDFVYLLNEESDDSTTFDGAHIVQEDEAGEFSQGFKIQQEGTFTDITTEGRLIQEDNTFLLLESQIVDENGPLGLENPLGDIQEIVYMELEQSIGGDSAVRADNISHFVLEEDEDLVQTIKLESGFELLYEDGGSILLSVQGEAATIRILNEEEFSNFKLEEFDSFLVQEEQYQIQLESGTEDNYSGNEGFLIKEDNDALHLEEAGAYANTSDEFYDTIYADHGLFTFVKNSVGLGSQDNDMRDVKFNNDGTKMFALGRGNDGVYEYSLSKAFDISTLTFVHKLDISDEETAANSIEFNLDGTKLFVLGQSDDNVDEYALSTGFALSTASFTDSFDVSTQEGAPYGLAFNNEGTKMYVVGWNGDDVNEYTLTTGFDVSTASYSQNFSTEGTGRSNPSAVQFNADGTFMYTIQGDTNPRIQEYALTTAFDISTASFTNRVFDLTNEENRARGFCFSNNHSQLFVTGWRGDDINEYTVNYSLPDESGYSDIDSTPSFFLFEDDDADARSYLLEEPTTIYKNIESENPADHFVIRLDDLDGNIILEREEFVTDTTFKGEFYRAGSGFTLPMLLFPIAESGSALLDLSFTSRIVMEIDDIQNVRLEDGSGSLLDEDGGGILYEQQETTSVGYQYDMILLEESDGTNPVYIATESSMTEEVDTLREIDIISDGDMNLQLENIHGVHDNGFLINEESSGIRLEAGTSSEGEIIFEDEEKLLLEIDLENKFQVALPSIAASLRPTVSALNTGDTLNEGSFLTKGFGNRTFGSVSFSELSSEFELITEDGKSYATEQSTSSGVDNLISETYERGAVVTGTATHFEFDFNNLIVQEGIGELGVIELESATPEDNSICLEADDPDIFELIQMEGATILLENQSGPGAVITEDGFTIVNNLGSNGSLASEEDVHTINPSPARLCNNGVHDLILEEEGILQEEAQQIQLEDFTVSLDNVAQEDFTIGQLVPFLGFGEEDDGSITISDNIQLEEETHKTENFIITTEDGQLIAQEEDGASHIVLDDFYLKHWSEGTITQSGTTVTISDSLFPSPASTEGRLKYANNSTTPITAVSANQLELTVENSATISSAENYVVQYALDDYEGEAAIVMEAFTLDGSTEALRADILLNGFTRGEDTDGLGTFTLTVTAYPNVVGNDIVQEDGNRILNEDSIGGYIAFEDSPQNVSLGIAHSRVLNEDDTGCFIATEDFEVSRSNENVLIREMTDAILLEDSETENINYVLTEDGGQIMQEDTFQVTESRIILEDHESILIEDQPDGDTYKLLNMDMSRFDIGVVANNTSMTLELSDSDTSTTDFFKRSDSAILVSRTEQIVG